MSKAITQFSSKNVFKFLYTCSYLQKSQVHMKVIFNAWKVGNFGSFFCMPCLLRLLVHVYTTTVKKRVPRNTFFRNPEPNRVLTVCSCHVTYTFQSESTLYSCLNFTELLARSRHEIWSLSGCNWTQTQNHLVRKRTPNHLAKLASLAKWLSIRLRTKWFWVWVQLESLNQIVYLKVLAICKTC